MLRGSQKSLRVRSKKVMKLAKRASEDKNARVRRFWTAHRVVYTLVVIEMLRQGERFELFAQTWFVPFMHYLHLLAVVHPRRGGELLKYFSAFAATHGLAYE